MRARRKGEKRFVARDEEAVDELWQIADRLFPISATPEPLHELDADERRFAATLIRLVASGDDVRGAFFAPARRGYPADTAAKKKKVNFMLTYLALRFIAGDRKRASKVKAMLAEKFCVPVSRVNRAIATNRASVEDLHGQVAEKASHIKLEALRELFARMQLASAITRIKKKRAHQLS